MAEIFGTPRADVLVGTDENDLIRGGRGEDTIYGELGDDTLYGGWGNDVIQDGEGRNEIYGGRGGDVIAFRFGHAYGGLGNDSINVSGGGWAIGGVGDDRISGYGYLWGDQTSDMPQQAGGNDTLAMQVDATDVRANGGLGSDKFLVSLGDLPGIAVIDDFTPGVDKINISSAPGGEEVTDLFAIFDANHNGTIEETDFYSGAGVYVDVNTNTMFLSAGGSMIAVHGTTSISHADWVVT